MSDEPKKPHLHDADEDEAPAPRIPRRSSRFPMNAFVKIFALIIALIAVIGMRKSCGQSVGNFFQGFAPGPDAGMSGRRPILYYLDGGMPEWLKPDAAGTGTAEKILDAGLP
jgi:hypothetical protein